jgi:hypothetical protein
MWKVVTQEEKQKYENLANLDKERYRREVEEFKRSGVVPGSGSGSKASTSKPSATTTPAVKKEIKSEEFVDDDDF